MDEPEDSTLRRPRRFALLLFVLLLVMVPFLFIWLLVQYPQLNRQVGQALGGADQIRHLLPLGIVGLLSWSVWIVRVTLSKFYRPVPIGYLTTASVVVPSYREDPDTLSRCLQSWLAEDPDEVIVVPDLEDHEVIARLRQVADPRLRVIPFAHEGKRSALGVGMRAARSEVIVLSDSDTQWEPGLLEAVLAPFADPKVGGVGTRQNVYKPDTSVWRRVADWMIDIRYLDYVPSQGRAGAVACLSGRTEATGHALPCISGSIRRASSICRCRSIPSRPLLLHSSRPQRRTGAASCVGLRAGCRRRGHHAGVSLGESVDEALQDHIEHWDDEDADHSCGGHAEYHRRTEHLARHGARASRDGERQRTQDERE